MTFRALSEDQIQIPTLDPDVLKEIFKILTCQMYSKLSLVSKKWNKLVDDSLFKEIIYKNLAFTPFDWDDCCGPLSKEEMEEPFKLLPKNIVDILKKKCTAFSDKRILDTHKLIWIPEKIMGKQLTVNCLKKLLKKTDDGGSQLEGDTLISSGWVLMANEVLTGSLGKPYSVQKIFLESLNKKDEIAWEVPKLSEVITCLSLIYLKFGKIAAADSLYTWCQEKDDRRQIAIKCYADSLMHSNGYFNNNYDFIGVAPIWHL